uniref:RRM domain-containing protein n=1 Tax=Erythrolobus australicus TaxID=1077150 RepID=A0A7S1TMW5_9RHOD|mmetsp:Transcript_945/g.2626  ORF Transcript_945/g.2626 Transcript_945/m.2626 type:complete len:711 (+) Transcript_945:462-2594(+)
MDSSECVAIGKDVIAKEDASSECADAELDGRFANCVEVQSEPLDSLEPEAARNADSGAAGEQAWVLILADRDVLEETSAFEEVRALVASLGGTLVEREARGGSAARFADERRSTLDTLHAVSRVTTEGSPADEQEAGPRRGPAPGAKVAEDGASDGSTESYGSYERVLSERSAGILAHFKTKEQASSAVTMLDGYALQSDSQRLKASHYGSTRPTWLSAYDGDKATDARSIHDAVGKHTDIALAPPRNEGLVAHSVTTEKNANHVEMHPEAQYPRRGSPYVQTKLFVGQLPQHVDEPELIAHFSPYGEIVRCHILRQGEVSRGCGFVQYATREQAEHAMAAMNGACVFNSRRALNVNFAESSTQKSIRLQQKSTSSLMDNVNRMAFSRSASSFDGYWSEGSPMRSPMLRPANSIPVQNFAQMYGGPSYHAAQHPMYFHSPQNMQMMQQHGLHGPMQPFVYSAYSAPYVMAGPHVSAAAPGGTNALYGVGPEQYAWYYFYNNAAGMHEHATASAESSTSREDESFASAVPARSAQNKNAYAQGLNVPTAQTPDAGAHLTPSVMQSPGFGAAPAPLPPSSPMDHVAHGVAAQCLYSPMPFYAVPLPQPSPSLHAAATESSAEAGAHIPGQKGVSNDFAASSTYAQPRRVARQLDLLESPPALNLGPSAVTAEAEAEAEAETVAGAETGSEAQGEAEADSSVAADLSIERSND